MDSQLVEPRKGRPGGSLPGERRGGRAKGTPNRTTGLVKEMVLQALKGAGGAKYLQAVAHTHPQAFCALLGRVLPLQVTGADGGQLVVEIVRFGELPDADEVLAIEDSSDTAVRAGAQPSIGAG